jgi:hypothetical protein
MFAQGTFQRGPNETPETIARKRAMIAAMMPRYGKASYIGEGLGQLFQGIGSGMAENRLAKAESEGTASANSLFDRLMGASSPANPGMAPLSVLGMMPTEPVPPPNPNSPHALGNDAMAALGKPAMTTAADPASIKAGLVARGLPEHVAEGFVMNFQDESGLNPGINEVSPLVPGSRGGFGLYQLTGPRRVAYEQFAAERGVPVDDVDAQLDFLMTELQGSEARAAGAILSTKSPGEAGAAIVNEFLRPAESHRASRAAEYLGGGGMPSTRPYAPGTASIDPGPPIAELYMALQNPWLSAEQKGMITSMIARQEEAADPLRQLELQKAQIELAQLQNPQDATPEELVERLAIAKAGGLVEGTPEHQTYILTGKLPGEASGDIPADFQSLRLRAEAAGLQPGTPEYQSFMAQGAGGGAPAAFVALDMQAQAAGFIPGTPEYQEFMATRGAGLQAQATVQGKAAGEAVTNLGGAIAKGEQAVALINQISNDPALAGITGMIQGNLPPLTQAGTDLNVKVQQLQGKVFLEAFESLKGGGQITEIEGLKAEQAVARLNRAQSEAEFKAALAELREVVENGIARAKGKASSAQGNMPTGNAPSAAPSATGIPPVTLSPEALKWMEE